MQRCCQKNTDKTDENTATERDTTMISL